MEWNIIIVAIASACITYFLNIHLNKGPVLASAIVTLIAGLLLPSIFKEGATLALVATTVSYAAMVSTDRFPNIYEMIFVGMIASVIFIFAEDVFIGIGGKLGSIAAISGLSWFGIKQLFEKYKVKKSEKISKAI